MARPLSIIAIIFFIILAVADLGAQDFVYRDVNHQLTEKKYAFYIQKNLEDSAGHLCLEQRFTNGNLYFKGCIIGEDQDNSKNNKYIGWCKWYYRNGNIKRNIPYNEAGKMDGLATLYHENGTIKSSQNYKNGILDDKKMLYFNPDGEQYTLFKENFNSNQNDWEVYKSDLNEAFIDGGKLTLNSFTERGSSRFINMPISSHQFEIELEIDVPDKKDPSLIRGLIFDFKDWDNYRYFFIQDDYFSVGFVDDGVHKKTADLLSTIRIQVEDINNLKVKSEIDKCHFLINNERVHSLRPITIKNPKVGVVVGGIGVARFNSLSVKELNLGGGDVELDDEDVKGSGSGFLFSKKGYIITNHHVIEKARRIFVEFPSIKKTYIAKLVIEHEETDLALLQIEDVLEEDTFDDIPFTLSTKVHDVGSSVFTLGFPHVLSGQGREVKFADGKISSKTGFDNDLYIYQTTIPIQPGNSGSPMFDESGDITGCLNATYRNADNVSYSIKSSYIRTLIQSTKDNIELPENNTIKDLKLTEKIKVLSNFICIIKVI